MQVFPLVAETTTHHMRPSTARRWAGFHWLCVTFGFLCFILPRFFDGQNYRTIEGWSQVKLNVQLPVIPDFNVRFAESVSRFGETGAQLLSAITAIPKHSPMTIAS